MSASPIALAGEVANPKQRVAASPNKAVIPKAAGRTCELLAAADIGMAVANGTLAVASWDRTASQARC